MRADKVLRVALALRVALSSSVLASVSLKWEMVTPRPSTGVEVGRRWNVDCGLDVGAALGHRWEEVDAHFEVKQVHCELANGRFARISKVDRPGNSSASPSTGQGHRPCRIRSRMTASLAAVAEYRYGIAT